MQCRPLVCICTQTVPGQINKYSIFYSILRFAPDIVLKILVSTKMTQVCFCYFYSSTLTYVIESAIQTPSYCTWTQNLKIFPNVHIFFISMDELYYPTPSNSQFEKSDYA
jgi:hypothetical protein